MRISFKDLLSIRQCNLRFYDIVITGIPVVGTNVSPSRQQSQTSVRRLTSSCSVFISILVHRYISFFRFPWKHSPRMFMFMALSKVLEVVINSTLDKLLKIAQILVEH